MVGSVHPIQTIELLFELQRVRYDGVIYFDTFPDHSGLDPVSEAKTNMITVNRFFEVVESLSNDKALEDAIAQQDPTTSMRIIQSAMAS